MAGLPGRPYELHSGEEIQIRHTIILPDRSLRKGTTATVTEIDPHAERLALTLADSSSMAMDRKQIEQADLRLGYVQHPVPAQSVTTDTTHLIVAEHATAEGTYVALTRARERTDIHASEELLLDSEFEPLARLVERVGRAEAEVPSIAVPLSRESGREREGEWRTMASEPDRTAERDNSLEWEI